MRGEATAMNGSQGPRPTEKRVSGFRSQGLSRGMEVTGVSAAPAGSGETVRPEQTGEDTRNLRACSCRVAWLRRSVLEEERGAEITPVHKIKVFPSWLKSHIYRFTKFSKPRCKENHSWHITVKLRRRNLTGSLRGSRREAAAARGGPRRRSHGLSSGGREGAAVKP